MDTHYASPPPAGQHAFNLRMAAQACCIESYWQAQQALGRRLELEDAAFEWIDKYAARFAAEFEVKQ